VGVPGDLIELRKGRLYVNGGEATLEAAEEPFVDPRDRELVVVNEEVERCTYQVLDDPESRPFDLAPTRVEEGRYFMMGDNRDDSHDSRFFGTVRFQEILGSAGLIYWSWNFTGPWGVGCLLPPDTACLGDSLLNPLTWWENFTEHTRWSRIGDSVSCG
jgi:signal peptidase I